MPLDHRGAHVLVAEQLLDRTNFEVRVGAAALLFLAEGCTMMEVPGSDRTQ
ncbi:MAG TPA: hypothetical protein VFG50_09340 [Rhodothermales bacterium]|nr:hypothetical protein [Rhodothermales bacterium]